jgi:hypothetical protein
MSRRTPWRRSSISSRLGSCCFFFFLGWIRHGLLGVVVVRVHAQLVPLRRARSSGR